MLRQRLERAPGVFHQGADQHLVDVVGHGETPVRQLIKTALIKKAETEFSLLFALEKPPGRIGILLRSNTGV